MNKYPNLNELIKCHPYSGHTICDHAQIEPELLKAALEGTEVLTPVETMAIARLYGCPVSVVTCPDLIMLEMGRERHIRMACEVDRIYILLKCMAKGGNKEAEKYLGWADWRYQNFQKAVCKDMLSYGHYFGARECFSRYVRFAMPEPKRRGLG